MMKIQSTILTLFAALAVAACVDYGDATQTVSMRVQLVMPQEFTAADYEGHEVQLLLGSQRLTATTDAEGVAHFNGIVPDVYDISCAWPITAEAYRQLTGDEQVVSGATVSGSLNAYVVSGAQTVSLATNLSIDRDIIIGKIYYAGSKDNNNRNYQAGKYVELYNQSNDTVDVGGLYIGLVEAESTQAYTLDNLHEAYADSVVLLKQAFRIPADAPHRVAPGGTVLLVNSAVNHVANDNDMEHDLTGADFEAKDTRGIMQNNPATPALELVYTMYPAISNMNLVQSGPCGVIIFRTADDVAQWTKVYAYGKTSGSQWLLLPKRHVIDGVETLRNTATGVNVSTKRLYADIDAGYVNINANSGWTGETVYRKTSGKRVADGHRILVDTNNSSNDFQVSTTIKPREYDE